MSVRNLSKTEINSRFRQNLKNQLEEKKQPNILLENENKRLQEYKRELELKNEQDERLKLTKKDELLTKVIENRKKCIDEKNSKKKEERKSNKDYDNFRIEQAKKEIEKENQKKASHKEIEKQYFLNVIKDKEAKQSNKKANKENEIKKDRAVAEEFQKVNQKMEEDRNSLKRNIQERLNQQDLRLQMTEEFLKNNSDNKHDLLKELNQRKASPCQNKNNKNNNIPTSPNTNILQHPKSPKRVNTLQKEISTTNANKDITDRRKLLQEETNKILKQQLEEKRNKNKIDSLENDLYKNKLINDSQQYKNEISQYQKLQKEKLINYKNELERQLTNIRCSKNNKITKGIIETNYQQANSDIYLSQVLKIVVSKLIPLGEHAILKLDNLFRLSDHSNKNVLDFKLFSDIIYDFGIINSIDMREDETLMKIFVVFSEEKSEEINYVHFINALKGELDERRFLMIKKLYSLIADKFLFSIFDKKILTFEYLKKFVKAVERDNLPLESLSQEEIFKEVVEGWETYLSLVIKTNNTNGYEIKLIDFLNYYAYISPLVSNDFDFERLINITYKISQNDFFENKTSSTVQLPKITGKKKILQTNEAQVKNCVESVNKLTIEDVKIFNHLRQLLYNSLGSSSIIKIKQLANSMDNLNSFDYFIKTMNQDLKLSLSPEEITKICQFINSSNKNSISQLLSYFIEILLSVSLLNEKKIKVIERLFNSLAVNGFVNLGVLKSIYNPAFHPKVIFNKKRENDVLNEFEDIFSFHFPNFVSIII